MKRRRFIGLTTGTLLGFGAGYFSLNSAKDNKFISLDAVSHFLIKFRASSVISLGEWSSHQIFHHLAQSIEFSLVGYPEHKPDWFKTLLGKPAYEIFTVKNAMTHSLKEVIPGAPMISRTGEVDVAIDRLLKAISDFTLFKGDLHSHFAYGELSHAEYEHAHLMHINDHMRELQFKPSVV